MLTTRRLKTNETNEEERVDYIAEEDSGKIVRNNVSQSEGLSKHILQRSRSPGNGGDDGGSDGSDDSSGSYGHGRSRPSGYTRKTRKSDERMDPKKGKGGSPSWISIQDPYMGIERLDVIAKCVPDDLKYDGSRKRFIDDAIDALENGLRLAK
jgi:hypothetical protein